MLFLHHVKASNRAAYERWFSEVWAPAVKAVAEKRASARPMLLAERDLRPAGEAQGGEYIYAYLYDPWVTDTGGPAGGFPVALLTEAGRSEEDAKKEAKVYQSLVASDEGHMFVQRQF